MKEKICEKCSKPYSDTILKKSYREKLGKENWCDDCIAESMNQDENQNVRSVIN